MANANKVTVFDIVMQMKDLASAALSRLQTNMEALPAATQVINAKLRQLQSDANEFTAKLTNDRVTLAEMRRKKPSVFFTAITNKG